MVREYLLKLQRLQRSLLGSRINLDIQNRMHKNGPWITVTISKERESEDEEFICAHALFDYYDFHTEEENRHRFESELKIVTGFIKYNKRDENHN